MRFCLPIIRLFFLLLCLLTLHLGAFGGEALLTNSLAQADAAKKRGDFDEALKIYDAAQQTQTNNAAGLCTLSRCYCDLTYMTNSADVQKDLVTRALSCAKQAVSDDPSNATAHASLAVCYAKSCNFADIKTELTYSRLFKEEAEKAIALDPKQDVAYYLLGRWNYGIANAGFVARTYVKVIYGGLPQASLADAITNFQEACTIAPDRILNHAGLAMAYDATGDKKSEIAELQKCCALKPLGPEDQDAVHDAKKKLDMLQQ